MSYIRPKLELLVQIHFQMIHKTQTTNISTISEFMIKGLSVDPEHVIVIEKDNYFNLLVPYDIVY